jgi:TolB-like protein/Flp pilus assembly protein TadD
MITIQLLGGASLTSDGAPIGGPPAQRHRLALVALAAASWPKPLARDRAIALLWPERDEANARRLLNLSLHVLRAALGEEVLASAGDGLLFNPAGIKCDLHDLRTAVAGNAPERVVAHYAGPLLDGFHLSESAEFGFWLEQTRRELFHAYEGALRAIAERQERSGDVHGRVTTCRRLVAADPLSGRHIRALMRALEAAGDRQAALREAAEHAHRLKGELDLEPDSGVVELAEKLRVAPPAPLNTRSGAIARQPAVAVLPFISLGSGDEHHEFADGITEDVIAQLSKISSLQVIARSSVQPFRDRQPGLKEIGSTLGAARILDGSVRHAGDRVRIVVTLVDVRTGRQLWAETYDRQITDIFEIQTDVALQIAAALKAKLSPAEQSRIRKEPTRDPQAHRLYLQGRRWWNQNQPGGYDRAVECFERAVARDPAFALAWANLALVHTELSEIGLAQPSEIYPKAETAVAEALRLDPELGEAHLAIGFLKCVRDFDWTGAEESFQRALELCPSNADVFDLYGRMCAALERYSEAIPLLERARELDPLTHRVDLATALLRAGRYDEALRRTQESVELDPDHPRSRATLGWALFLSGREQEGLAELERAVELSRRNPLWLGQLGQAHARAGNQAKAREILRELEQRGATEFVSPYHRAYVHVGLGEMEQAIALVEEAVAGSGGPAYGMKGSFLLEPLHDNPRFQALLRRMNLTP